MTITEQPISAVTQSHLPRHMKDSGELGSEMELEEWLVAQIRVASKAALEIVRPPRELNESDSERTIPRIEDEDLAYNLLQVHDKGIYKAKDSWKHIQNHPETSIIIADWLDKFGPLFNITCKQSQLPYERAALQIEHFQFRLVQHIQHQRRIFEDHSHGNVLSPSEAWSSMEWNDPLKISEGGIEFLRQSVYLPHVVGEGEDTKQVLDAMHNTRESLYTRLSPY